MLGDRCLLYPPVCCQRKQQPRNNDSMQGIGLNATGEVHGVLVLSREGKSD